MITQLSRLNDQKLVLFTIIIVKTNLIKLIKRRKKIGYTSTLNHARNVHLPKL